MPESRRRITGEYRDYVEFKAGARRLLASGEKDARQEYYYRLACLIFVAFSFEAFINHVGAKKFSKWWAMVDRVETLQKAKLLCAHLGVVVDFGARPFQTLAECIKRRNILAHSKYDSFDEVISVPEGDHTGDDMFPPRPRHQYAAREFLERANDDLQRAIEILLDAAQLENENPDSLGTSFGEPL